MSRFLAVAALLFALPIASVRAQGDSAASRPLVLGPGDKVRVLIWREKDLSGDFQVDETSHVTLPMLGPQSVRGVPWEQLQDSLQVLYRRELRAPSVTLTALRRVVVLGEVTKPGQYFADPTLSLAGIVALAGGASEQGDLGHLRVVRNGVVILEHASIEAQLQQMDVRSGDQIFVERRGWFDRNSAFVASAAISVASILITLLKR